MADMRKATVEISVMVKDAISNIDRFKKEFSNIQKLDGSKTNLSLKNTSDQLKQLQSVLKNVGLDNFSGKVGKAGDALKTVGSVAGETGAAVEGGMAAAGGAAARFAALLGGPVVALIVAALAVAVAAYKAFQVVAEATMKAVGEEQMSNGIAILATQRKINAESIKDMQVWADQQSGIMSSATAKTLLGREMFYNKSSKLAKENVETEGKFFDQYADALAVKGIMSQEELDAAMRSGNEDILSGIINFAPGELSKFRAQAYKDLRAQGIFAPNADDIKAREMYLAAIHHENEMLGKSGGAQTAAGAYRHLNNSLGTMMNTIGKHFVPLLDHAVMLFGRVVDAAIPVIDSVLDIGSAISGPLITAMDMIDFSWISKISSSVGGAISSVKGALEKMGFNLSMLAVVPGIETLVVLTRKAYEIIKSQADVVTWIYNLLNRVLTFIYDGIRGLVKIFNGVYSFFTGKDYFTGKGVKEDALTLSKVLKELLPGALTGDEAQQKIIGAEAEKVLGDMVNLELTPDQIHAAAYPEDTLWSRMGPKGAETAWASAQGMTPEQMEAAGWKQEKRPAFSDDQMHQIIVSLGAASATGRISGIPNINTEGNAVNSMEKAFQSADFQKPLNDALRDNSYLGMKEADPGLVGRYGMLLSGVDNYFGITRRIKGAMGFASGGQVDATGLAMLHGSPGAPEEVLSAGMTARAPGIVADALSQLEGSTAGAKSNYTINIKFDNNNFSDNASSARIQRELESTIKRVINDQNLLHQTPKLGKGHLA